MRRGYDDFYNDDRREECVHGYTKACPECEAEAEEYLARERYEAFSVRARWFAAGVLFLMIVEMVAVWLVP